MRWLLVLLLACDPPAVGLRPSDNIKCKLKGFDGTHIVCYTELPFKGGRCDCSGVPYQLICERVDKCEEEDAMCVPVAVTSTKG